MMRHTRIITSLMLGTFCVCLACVKEPQPRESGDATTWSPVYGAYEGRPYPVKDHWRYRRAHLGQAQTLSEARTAFERFLSDPNNYAEGEMGSYEDASHIYAMETAKYELMRIYYLLGLTEHGDNMIRHLDPLDLLAPEDMFIVDRAENR